jgi:hypothetical protein
MSPEDMADMIGNKETSPCRFIEAVHVVERVKGQVAWDGVVLVFGLDRPPEEVCYGWVDPTTESLVTVLNRPPVESPQTAVRAYIVAQGKGL